MQLFIVVFSLILHDDSLNEAYISRILQFEDEEFQESLQMFIKQADLLVDRLDYQNRSVDFANPYNDGSAEVQDKSLESLEARLSHEFLQIRPKSQTSEDFRLKEKI